MGCRKLQLNDYFRFIGNESDIQYAESQHRKNRPMGFSFTYNANDQLTLEANSVKGDNVYAYDTNGSQIGKVNTKANESYLYSYSLQNRFDYDAYGKNLFTVNVTNPSSTDMLYSGEQFDPNLQMQYLRARYYDQSNGRFNRLDPFAGNNSDPQGLHKYGYAHCNPVMGIDPSGNMSLIMALGVISVMGLLLTMTGCSAQPPPLAYNANVHTFQINNHWLRRFMIILFTRDANGQLGTFGQAANEKTPNIANLAYPFNWKHPGAESGENIEDIIGTPALNNN